MPFKSVARLCLGLSIALLPFAASAQTAPKPAAPAAAWTSFTPAEGGFSVVLPGKPERSEGVIGPDQGGPGKTYFYTVQGEDSMFLVGWGEYAPSFKFDNQAELDANRDNFVEGIEADLVTQKPLTLAGAPGLEFDFAKAGVLFGRGRVYIIAGKPYQLVFMHRGSALDTARATRFLDSFRPSARR